MKKLVIKNIGQILSGKLEEPIFDGDCIIAIDGKIMEWGAEKDLDCEGATTLIDAHGVTVMPGLIDSHIHPVIGDYTPRQQQLNWIDSTLHGGVTTLISAGEVHMPGRPKDIVGLKAMAIAAQRWYENFRPSGVKVHAGAPVIEHGMVEQDFKDLAEAGVTLLGEVGLGTVKDGKTAQQMVVVVSRKDLWRKRAKANLNFLDQTYDKEGLSDRELRRKKMASDYYSKLIPTIYTDFLGILGFLKYVTFQIVGLFRPIYRQTRLSDMRIVAHKSANPKQVSTAIIRGAFEFQGQKCSAASRSYISESIWKEVKGNLITDIDSLKMGTPADTSNFITAVIHENSFDKIAKYIEDAKSDNDTEIIAGGNYDKSKGYFIEPTIIVTKDPNYKTMHQEIFGPVMTIYIFKDDQFDETLSLVDQTSDYALTGAILATDRYAVAKATKALQNCAGNFYINDKPTGAVVGQQPFGGARGSGTNDKAGSVLNLLRWVSPRLIKETFVTPTDYRYPFLGN